MLKVKQETAAPCLETAVYDKKLLLLRHPYNQDIHFGFKINHVIVIIKSSDWNLV
jgi:hypothetical protein